MMVSQLEEREVGRFISILEFGSDNDACISLSLR